MAGNRRRRSVRPSLERLEPREAPSAAPWLSESFDSTPVGALPSGWSQWSNNAAASFAVSAAQSFSPPQSLVVSSSVSSAAAEAWYNPVAAADVQVSAAVLVNMLIPAQIIARGSGLGTLAPSYYAVAITRGLELDLVRVVNGTSTTLATLTSASWFSDLWTQVTLSVSGTTLQAQVFRPDTSQYLNGAGQWQASQTWALTTTDAALSGPGNVGVGRPGSYAGAIAFDDFTANPLSPPPLPPPPDMVSESFDSTAAGALPAGWTQWSNNGSAAFAVSSALALSPPNGLAVTASVSNLASVAWETTPQPADLQVSAAVYVTSLIPALVLARGSGLNTSTPSYYAVAVTRGMEVDLLRVVNGVSTTLATLTTPSWFSDDWVRVTLVTSGTTLQAQVFRPDTAQYLNAAGQWQTAPAYALTATDAAVSGSGLVGVGRPGSYTGTVTFDDFSITVPNSPPPPPPATVSESFDSTAVGALPAGWTQWSSNGSAAFAVSSALALSPPNGLAVAAAVSNLASVAWETTPQPADLQVSAAVYVTSLIPALVLARGSGLNTSTPSYYAVAVTRGMEVDLLRVVNGVSTTLATLTTPSWFSDDWVRVTLVTSGTTLQAQVFRPDTAQYLNASGEWQPAPAYALTATDAAVSGSGFVGVGRPGSYTGTVTFDDFSITVPSSPPPPPPATASESFDSTAVGALPAGWTQWSSNGSAAFAVSSALALSPPNGLAVTASVSNLASRAWETTPQPADLQVSAAVYVTSLIPALVLARGSGLNTTTPSYYAVAVTRGMEVDLLRVVNGVSTTLATLTTPGWFSDDWVRVTLVTSGISLQAQVFRPDTAQYLNTAGQWQTAQVYALTASDAAVFGSGLAGVGRPGSYTGTVTFDDFSITVPSSPPPPPGIVESFDSTATGALPAGWAQWSSDGNTDVAVSSALALSPPNNLAVNAQASSVVARAWLTSPQPADVQVSAAVYVTSIIPAQVLARGSALNTSTPSYYAVAVTRGMEVDLLRVVNGVSTTLATLLTADWFSDGWVRVTLVINGTTLQAQVFRPDTAQYLNAAGQWQNAQTYALAASDAAVSGSGLAGVGRSASYSGTVNFDDFAVTSAAGSQQPPVVTFAAPLSGATLSGVTTVQASVTGSGFIAKVEFYVDGVLRTTVTAAPYQWAFDTSTASNGTHTLMALAYDVAGNVGQASVTVVTQNSTALSQPIIPQHLPNIRILQLDYSDTAPLGPLEVPLLQNDVDLVVGGGALASTVLQVSPSTPVLTYTNVSNIYGSLLTSWLDYANANGLYPEGAFYHVTQATPFTGTSPSSQPVDWFWAVYATGLTTTDLTAQANGSQAGGVPFSGAGTAINIAYPDPFNEINLQLTSGAGSGWSAVLEYPSAVDANGNPTAWSPLPTDTDTTNALTQSGQVTFDPPADWKMAALNGSALMYYVRYRTVSNGTAPVAATILGDDYLDTNGTDSGVIPAFDMAADTNHDGYLDDAEYANRAPGMNARFLYQSRAFYGSYGQMRFATNPSDAGFRAWAVQYNTNLLANLPTTASLFVDNSGGNFDVSAAGLRESYATYSVDYGSLLNAIAQAIAPRWIMANTAGDGPAADSVIENVQAYFEEFAIRPLADNYQQFEALAAQTAYRASLTSPARYAVLDSDPQGGSPTDPRTQLATLAYYYLLADPTTTFLDFYGGYAPSTAWDQHWSPAAAYNIGQPLGPWSLFATGADPENTSLTYQVLQRAYGNALVLYRPLSTNANGSVTGTTDDATAVTFALSGTYQPLNADGSLGAPITSISLRNGEGAILVKM